MLRIVTCLSAEHGWPLVALAASVCLVTSLTTVLLFHRTLSRPRGTRAGWIAGTGASAGSGIFATLFIATLAHDPGMVIGFDFTLAIGSLVVAIAMTVAGVAVAASRMAFAAPLGGAIIGAGTAATHYSGIASLELAGQIAWSADFILVSILVSLTLAASALGAAARGRNLQRTLAAA